MRKREVRGVIVKRRRQCGLVIFMYFSYICDACDICDI